MFDSIASTYDRLNHLLSLNFDRLWRRRVSVMASRRSPKTVLDIATGTGDLAVSLARKIPGARITGVDISEGMIAVGREKIARKGLPYRISLEVGDAERLSFDDGSFDCVTAGFGVRNFQDIDASLAEMHRVLRCGGELLILEFSSPQGRVFGPLYRFYFHRILPFVGRLVSKDGAAYEYLPASVDEFPEKCIFLQMIERAGFGDCRAKRLMGGVAYIYKGVKL